MRMRDELEQKVGLRFSKGLMAADDKEIYLALLELTQEKLEAAAKIQGERKLYYISAEFLVGKLLSNNLINLPAQFPTRSFLPVNALYMVVFTLLGFPAKAILILQTSSFIFTPIRIN